MGAKPLQLAVCYHVWSAGHWQQPFQEFKDAVERSGFDGDVMLGVVGPKPLSVVAEWPGATILVAEPEGNEWVTLNALRQWCRGMNGAVLYGHTKGAFDNSDFRARWRQSMTRSVVGRWRENLRLLETHDAVGCHWLTEDRFPGMFGAMTVPADGSGFFGGNFWMARCSYVRKLPDCPSEPRWSAEQWIGTNHPRVVDLLPGWPHDNRWPDLARDLPIHPA